MSEIQKPKSQRFANIDSGEARFLFASHQDVNPETCFLAHLIIKPSSGMKLEDAATRVALIISVRTVRKAVHEDIATRKEQMARIVGDVDHNSGRVTIAIPDHLCTPREGMGHLLTLLTAPADYEYADEYWVDNVQLPTSFIQSYQGPRYGVEGFRKLLGIENRPILAVILKPRGGVSTTEMCRIYEEALLGGADALVDDLLLVDPEGECSFHNRLSKFGALAAKCSSDHLPKWYFVNLGSDLQRALLRYEAIATLPGPIRDHIGAVLLNGFVLGFDALNTFCTNADMLQQKNGWGLPVISTNFGSGILTRQPRLGKHKTGLSEAIVAKLSRLAGADAIHTGTSSAECYGEYAWGVPFRELSARMPKISTCFAVAEGDLTIANLWENIRSLGLDCIIEPTTGVLNYPDGKSGGNPRLGAQAFLHLINEFAKQYINHGLSETERQAQNILFAAGKKHRYIRDGLEYFGWKKRENDT